MSEQTALILGASGSFGGAMMAELARRGWKVSALVRDPKRLERNLKGLPPVTVLTGDATDAATVVRAARGASAIVHGVNYPYHQWVPHMRQVTDAVIEAAETAGSTIVFPGNVYNFGPALDRPFVETDAFKPNTRKGKLRVELERLLSAAVGRAKARVLIVRAGDFFGPTVRNGLVDPIFGNAKKHRMMTMFGNPDIPHQWAFVPDMARLACDLLDMGERLNPFEVVHFKGHVVDPGRRIAKLAAISAGLPELKVFRIPWIFVRLVGLFDGVVRELMEMRYLFDTSVIIDDPRRRELLPNFKDTPLEVAVLTTVDSYVDPAKTN